MRPLLPMLPIRPVALLPALFMYKPEIICPAPFTLPRKSLQTSPTGTKPALPQTSPPAVLAALKLLPTVYAAIRSIVINCS